jgi:tyrosyl-tRNA synthetase
MTMTEGAALLDDLQARDLVVQTTGEDDLGAHLAEPRTVYCGFDPTADSLHIGSLVPLLALRRFQLAGHRPICLVGGATGLVGDPSFKAAERRLNSADTVRAWADAQRRQMERFLDFEGSAAALMVNNLDWLGAFALLDFLRDVGKHFAVNAMIQKESVRQRIEREGEGISFTEFTYMILQAYDFAELNRRFGCTLQIGGSDQWGNITAGIDLSRRQNRAQVHGLTFPLVTKADGTKFGKTETGTIWLDPRRTSPYAFYQFLINTADADVYRFLRYFTFLPVAEIAELEAADRARQGKPEAQGVLARELTRLVHGAEGLEGAQRITEALFNDDLRTLSEGDFEQLRLDGLPSLAVEDLLESDESLTNSLAAPLGLSGKQAKDALQRGAVLVNDRACTPDDMMNPAGIFADDAGIHGRYYAFRIGKKKRGLLYRRGGG